MIPRALLRCPHCQQPFTPSGGALVCPQGHLFDVARAGYVNLLRKPLPGDSKEMLLARRAFLDRGHYAPIGAALVQEVRAALAAGAPGTVGDAGCGEGTYLGGVLAALADGEQEGTGAVGLGLDVAKEAVQLAARRYPAAGWLVANLWESLPLVDAVFGVLLNVFAPRNPAEFARIVAPGGWLLVVIPAPDHLAELRATLSLLDIEADKEAHVVGQFAGAFTLLGAHTIHYPITLDTAALGELVAMTPNARHLTPITAAALAALPTLTTQVSVRLLVFGRAE